MALLGLAGAAPAAPDLAQTGTPPERVASLIVYGNDRCPQSSADEIVVCARQPESDRYRVPKRFRNKRQTDAGGTAWGARAQTLEYVSRFGMPNSCSAVGSFGQTGCQSQFLAQWRAERKEQKAEAAEIP